MGRSRCKPCPRCGEVNDLTSNGYCRPCHNEYSREWVERNKERAKFNRWRNWLRRYGLTPEQYEAMLAAQGGGCAVCAVDVCDASGKRLHIDHDHETDRVRGLLCSRCNLVMGRTAADLEVLQRAVEYLGKHYAA